MTVRSDVELATAPGSDPEPSPSATANPAVRLARRAPAAAAAVVGLLGVLIQALGYSAGWGGSPDLAITLFYVGLVVLLAPYAALLLSAAPSPRSRVIAVISFGLLMYASWLAASPVFSSAFDETLHVTTLVDMTGGAGWFAPNTMLPVSPHYPGLELATTAVHWVTGLPLMACQVVVVAIARTVLVVGLYLLGSRLTRSARGGGIVVLLYAASPQFWFFNAQFSYQTVALALLVGAVLFQLRAFHTRPDAEPRERDSAWWPMIGVQACLAALAVTHHLTSWLTVGALWVVALVLAAFGEPRRARMAAASAQLGLLLVVAWSAVIAPLLGRYLGPVVGEAGVEVARLIRLDGAEHQALSESADNVAPLWESGVMALSILLWLALLLPSLRAAVAGRTLGRSPVRFVLVVLAALFPILFALRFSPKVGEIADRSSTFVTLGVVLVVTGWLVTRLDLLDRAGLRITVPAAIVLLVGGLILGSGPDWQRVPGPYLAGAEQRSVDAQTIAVADWAAKYLPARSRFAGDVTMSRVIPTVAPVDPVTGGSGSVNVTPLYINPTLDLEARQLLIRGKVDFVVVDLRMVGETVRSGAFFEGSNGWGPTARTLTSEQLGKFENAPGFRKVLDGPVEVYDVRGLRAEPQVFVDRESPGRPGEWQPAHALGTGMVALLALLLLLTRRRRRSWRPEHALPLLVTLPALIAIGAVGVSSGLAPAVGVVIGVLLAAAGLVVILRSSEFQPGWWRRVPLALVVGVLLGLAAAVSISGAWHGLYDADELAPPPTAQVAP